MVTQIVLVKFQKTRGDHTNEEHTKEEQTNEEHKI